MDPPCPLKRHRNPRCRGTAAETSPDNPLAPLQLLSRKLKAHIERAPAAWIEGQVIELNRRGR